MIKVGLISLGCAKNLVDAEVMLGSLLKAGMTIVNDPAAADALIVNTCSFIDPAKRESVQAVLEADEVRRHTRPDQALVVGGCMAQRYPDELRKEIPEIDALMGLNEVPRVAEIVQQAVEHRKLEGPRKARGPGKKPAGTGVNLVAPLAAPIKFVSPRATYIPDYDTPRFRLTPRHYAYVKIAEGCNHPCTFCVIPQMRGRHRSRTVESVVAEARHLLSEGVKELNLISQDTTYYGLDLWPAAARDRRPFDHSMSRSFGQASLLPIQNRKSKIQNLPTLCALVRELDALDGDFWIRLLYTHPAHWSDELIETIAESRHVARYVDMPLQHIHPAMLAAMRRETSEAWIHHLIARIRRGIPGVALRTTFLVGFPGETSGQFEHLLEFMREMRFDRVGVFLYSREDGSRAAKLPRQVPEAVKRERHARAMALQQQLSRERNAAMVGRRLRVLVDRPSNRRRFAWIARSEADAPDVDGRVYLAERSLRAGEFLDVTVTGSSEYDLTAKPVA